MKRREFFQTAAAFAAAVPASACANVALSGERKPTVAEIGAFVAGEPVLEVPSETSIGVAWAVNRLSTGSVEIADNPQMAGARLGFAVGSRELIGDLDRVRYSFHPYNVDSMTQAAGAAALMQPDYFEACRKSTMETRAWTRDQLEGIGFSVLPSKANFLFAKPPKISGKACQDALRERNILVRRFDLPRVKDYLRITIGSKEQMNALIRALKEMIA